MASAFAGAGPETGSVLVSIRAADGTSTDDLEWARATGERLAAASPWRTFRWYKGQKHYSGTYWSATMRGHVIYESRLELSRLIFADFDQAVQRILAQPFLLKANVDRKIRKHIPDYFLVTDHGPVVVDVKPRHLLAKPKVAYTFAWTRQVIEARGWQYEVWSEPQSFELENLRFLAGYRRPWLFNASLLDQVRDEKMKSRTIAETVEALGNRDPAVVRAAVLHLLWCGELKTDLSTPLGDHHQLVRPA